MKYSDNFVRDVRFYLRSRHRFTFFGGIVPPPPLDRTGVSGVKAFWLFDTKGRSVPTRHPRLFVALLQTKQCVNGHIKMWSEGFLDMLEPISHYMAQFIDPPAWVETSLRGAIERRTKAHPDRVKDVFGLLRMRPPPQRTHIQDSIRPTTHSNAVDVNPIVLTVLTADDIPRPIIDAYCVACCTKPNATSGRKFVAKSNGHSWGYYCSECGIGYFHAPPPYRRDKRLQYQIDSFIESEKKRISKEKLLIHSSTTVVLQ